VPGAGRQHHQGVADAGDVAIESVEKPFPLGALRREQRVDEHDLAGPFPVDATDGRLPALAGLPLGMYGEPAPETLFDAINPHMHDGISAAIHQNLACNSLYSSNEGLPITRPE
jgi:hypothetical protein